MTGSTAFVQPVRFTVFAMSKASEFLPVGASSNGRIIERGVDGRSTHLPRSIRGRLPLP
jgi:hypothetical protein